MSGIDIYDLFRRMEEDKVILSFKGEITQELLTSVYKIMEDRLQNLEGEAQKKKKFYHILVESLQNVYHHMIPLKADLDLEVQKRTAILMVGYNQDGGYRIITGNYVENKLVEKLQEKLEYVNSLSPEGLRQQYVEQLKTTELSEKGGAGLGLLDMARKSGQKLDFSIHPVSDQLSFFSLAITVQ